MKRRNIISIVVLAIIIILLIVKCSQDNHQTITRDFVKPPIAEADIPFSAFSVDASKGDTIIYKSGTVILFPKDAFVDKNGKIVKGQVDIKYREFHNPVDQFLSGIPMGYDSAGVSYTLESAGMCDIQAYKSGEAVFVNKKNKPEINISTNNVDVAQNLYYLDTTTKQWVNRGKSEIIEIGKKAVSLNTPNPTEITSTNSVNIEKPVKPMILDNEIPIIKVTIDTSSFEELKAYNNLRFQLDKTEKNFKPEDSYITWENIELKKDKQLGVYKIQFSKSSDGYNKSVEYKVQPVLDEKDYASALVEYDKKLIEYERKIKEREMISKENKDAYMRQTILDKKIDEENENTARLNKIIQIKNAEQDSINKKIEEQNKLINSANLNNYVVRNFEIDGFGIWNCDRPISTECFEVEPKYINVEGAEIKLFSASMIMKDINSIYAINTNKIRIPINKDCMLLAVVDGCLAYITYDEIKSYKVNADTKTQTFAFHIVAKENNNYNFISSIVRQ